MGFFDRILDIFSFGNTLYYPGCLTKFAAPDIKDNYVEILNMIGMDFVDVPEFVCCGKPARNAGHYEAADDLNNQMQDILRKYGIRRIVTNCPSCYLELSHLKGVKVMHITQVLAKNLHKLPTVSSSQKITYKEPCHLGRKGGVYEEPRAVIKALGFDLIEQDLNRNLSMCCGAGAGLRAHDPELSNKIGENFVKSAKTKRIFTTCPLCYKHTKENAPKGYEVYELSELILGKFNSNYKTGEELLAGDSNE